MCVTALTLQMASAVERMVQWGSGLVTNPVQVRWSPCLQPAPAH